jgi:hypothetical protein
MRNMFYSILHVCRSSYIQTVEYTYADQDGAQGTFPLFEPSYRLVK